MIKTTLKLDGMKCGMCESHINDIVRRTCKVKKVKSSHRKNEAVIISKEELDEEKLKNAIKEDGYNVLGYSKEEYVKKGFFSR